MTFTILRESDYRRMRWKNGLGETAEVAIAPDGAALDDFDWRVSMARVDADGPFSPFAGIDRTLSILAGGGLRLATQGAEAVDLGPVSAPYSFAGDVPCAATLLEGPVTDLNVMSRRDRCWHRVRRLGAGRVDPVADLQAAFLVASAAGPVHVVVDGTPAVLGAFDSVRLGAGPWSVAIAAAPPDALLLVEIGARAS
jgi:environmental stress-induced protein Ves